MTPYNAGQFRNLNRYLRFVPQWLLLGGPADADEAQTFVADYPSGNVIAVEPCRQMVEWQRANRFPSDGRLIHAALSDYVGSAELTVPQNEYRCSSIVNAAAVLNREAKAAIELVPTVTLDALRQQYGPFPDAILWLDIEGAEPRALRGAANLLASGDVRLINVEVMFRDVETVGKEIDDLLMAAGYYNTDHWDVSSGNHYDAVYLREQDR